MQQQNTRAYELVDNNNYGSHRDALIALGQQHNLPMHIATGYINLEGLHTLATIAQNAQIPARLMIGATPQPGELTGKAEDQFTQSINNLRNESNFEAFPEQRRQKLETVANFIQSDNVQVRRYISRFLHGKAYIFRTTNNESPLGAALVSSANLTAAGMNSNLELGMIQYQPNVVKMAFEWYQNLWQDAQDFKDELLELLLPEIPETDPLTVYLRALDEYYGDTLDDIDDATDDGTKLTSFQKDGYIRAKRILETHGGVLYADGVGMGKTEIGLQFIREHMREKGQQVLVITPAQLRDNLWQSRLAQENARTDIVSYQQLANDKQLSNNDRKILPVDKDAYRLIVIDEAHAYRNSDNTWYTALDKLMSGTQKQLLLLTATPVNNSLWDMHNLFLLFARHDSAFADEPLRIPSIRKFFAQAGANDPGLVSANKLFPLIDALTVRRDRKFIMKTYPNERFQDGTEVRFPEPILQQQRYNLDSAYPNIASDISKAIEELTMARYQPSLYLKDTNERQSEAAIAGFMQSMLLKRFESSWHSALKTTRRMIKAIQAILLSIEQYGVVPTGDLVNELVTDSEEGLTLQDELIEETMKIKGQFISAERFDDLFIIDLNKDLDKLNGIADKLNALQDKPDPKIDALKKIMNSTPSQKVAIFTSFKDTAEYLNQKIENDLSIIGNRSKITVLGADVDPMHRGQAVERFCPQAETEDATTETTTKQDEVDVLLSTDVLSEGQNLQQAQAVLSYDMPWNPQRVVQRNGRVIRLKSPHETVYLYTLLPRKGELDNLLELEAKLQAKINAANAAIGMDAPVLQNTPSEERIYADLNTFAERLATGDETLMDEDEDDISAAFVGEALRAELKKAYDEGEIQRIRNLPWGIGAAFTQKSQTIKQPAVFFACRTKNNERYWKMVSKNGEIMNIEDIQMLIHINPNEQPATEITPDWDLQKLFDIAAESIVEQHNALTDPANLEINIPASQRWALEILQSTDAPQGTRYNNAYESLQVGRNNRVRRALSAIRTEYNDGKGMTITQCANKILETVNDFGLAPVKPPEPPKPITKNDIGVLCYQIVTPEPNT